MIIPYFSGLTTACQPLRAGNGCVHLRELFQGPLGPEVNGWWGSSLLVSQVCIHSGNKSKRESCVTYTDSVRDMRPGTHQAPKYNRCRAATRPGIRRWISDVLHDRYW